MTAAWPDFYIVGAPKAGTTSLYQYLAAHPDVFLPDQKELWLFGSDLDVRNRRRWTADDLPELYRRAPAGSTRGLAYVWYLYSREAAREIAEVRPDARIVIALRDPVATLYALHSEFVYDGNEEIADFAQALEAEPDRCAGRRIPTEAHFPAGLCYRATVRYAEQVERYLDRFGADRVHVLLFDDLLADPEGTGTAVVRFLGLSASRRTSPFRTPTRTSAPDRPACGASWPTRRRPCAARSAPSCRPARDAPPTAVRST